MLLVQYAQQNLLVSIYNTNAMILEVKKSEQESTKQQQILIDELCQYGEAPFRHFSDLLPEVDIKEKEEEEIIETDEDEWEGDGDWNDDDEDSEYEEWYDEEVDWDDEEYEDVEWEDVEYDDEE